MSARYRPVDLAVGSVLVLVLVGVASTMLAMVGPADEQAVCAANLRLFGQASADYVATWGVFAPCDPWQMMPESIDALERSSISPAEKFDPPHGWLLYQMGYVPFIGDPVFGPWWQAPYGFRMASVYRGRDGVPPPAICPAAILENVMDEDSPEIDPNDYWGPVPIYYKYAACYAPNRLLHSPADGMCGNNSRLPVQACSEAASPTCDNQFTTASVRVQPPGLSSMGPYYIQAINNDELVNPADTVYMSDSLDYRIGTDTVPDAGFPIDAVNKSAGSPFAFHLAVAVPLGARHGGKANVLYADGHVSDDNQTPRNRRGDLITASTFTDYIPDYGIGTQHHLMPTGRWIGTNNGQIYSPAPGDDEPPTVLATWPGHDESVCSLRAGTVKVQFSEQVWINDTNVLVNNGAVVPTGTSYDSHDASFTLSFDPPLPFGTYVVVVRPAVTDLVGNQLDGNGDGVGGDVYPFRFYVRAELLVGAGGDYPTIQAAIDAAADGDVIVVQPGSYPERITFRGKAVTVRSTDPTDPATVASTVLDASSLVSSGDPVVSFTEGEGPESILEGVTITGGNSWRDGGGIGIEEASPTIRFCRIQANQAASGGGIFCFEGSPTIQACLVRANIADYGAGLYSIDSFATLISNVLAQNHAYAEGSAIYSGGFAEDLVLNNTIVGNVADGGGLGGAAVLVLLQAHTGLFSNLFWANSDFDLVVFDAEPAVACNLFAAIPPGYEGNGNLAANPLLANWPAGDYHIGYDSPCFNAGSPWFAPPSEISDMDGQPRVALGRVDIGADEIAQAQGFIVDGQGGGDFTTIQAAIDAAPGQQEIIRVLPGTYPETITFHGKAITVTSTDPNDPAVVAATIIDGGSGGAVVTFNSGELRGSVLAGFTITHSQPVNARGISCNSAEPTITQNRVTGNAGGGVYARYGSPLISHNEISANTASQGAGLYLDNAGGTELIANRIAGNQATTDGGGVYASGGYRHLLVRNVIQANTASQRGGGLYLYSSKEITMANNLVVANAANDGGAMYASSSTFYATNNTFAHSSGQRALYSVYNLRHCILFNPAAGAENSSWHAVSYCLIRGWTGGGTNFDADPQFVDPASGDYHLAATSPCINAGDPIDFAQFGVADLDGDLRVLYGRIDVGADEYAGTFVPRFLSADPPADGTLPKTANNTIRLIFNGPVVLPAGPALSIVPLAGGSDLGGSFTYQLQTTTVGNDTLRAVETGSVLTNQTWYRISPAAGLDAQPFSLDLCVLFGDADASGQVLANDYFAVKNHLLQTTDARYDLDGDGQVLATDYFVVKNHLFDAKPPKP